MPLPTGNVSTAQFEGEIQNQIAVLDAMFDDPGLTALRTKSPHHPAVVRRDALAEFLPRRTRPVSELVQLAASLGVMAIDRQFWMRDASDDYWSFLTTVGSANRVRQNIRDPADFDETIAEVRTWAHLRFRSVDADLIEEDGKPDIPVARHTPEETWIEVKFVHATTTDNGFRRVLKKANSQLREASSDGAGVAYLWIERPLDARELPRTQGEADAGRLPSGEDPPPPGVAERLAAVERALASGNFKSVGFVVVAWDDHGYIADGTGVTYFVRRQCLVREHPSPRGAVSLDAALLPLGGWAAMRIGLSTGGNSAATRSTELSHD